MNNNFNKIEIISEIKKFLDGTNNEIKYLVNVETDKKSNTANCVIHEPGKSKRLVQIQYTPFIFIKDLKKYNIKLYNGDKALLNAKMGVYGISIKPLKTGKQERLENGYKYIVESNKSLNSIFDFFKDSNFDFFEKKLDHKGRPVKDHKGKFIYPNSDLCYYVTTNEQFFISKRTRLFKGFDEYKNVHKMSFDIETTGLKYQIHRLISIGIKDNRGFQIILEPEKENDDESEIKLIQEFFYYIDKIKPAIILGHNIEGFDFDFIIGRAKKLNLDLALIKTTLNENRSLYRKNATVKLGNTAEKYTATEMWGYSIVDTLHAAKKTAALNTEIKNTKLKYIIKYEGLAKDNRTYIDGSNGNIGKFWNENKNFVISDINEYIQIPEEYQDISNKLILLQNNKNKISDEEYNNYRKQLLNNKKFIEWFRNNAIPKKMLKFIKGKDLVKQYLLDDLWETEQVDELYNQSAFLLAKIIPETYTRVCTMGTAAIWNLILTAWSYENGIAIPYKVKKEDFSGGLARCYKKGYSKKLVKIDYASLYPMIQLTEDVFPIFDITGVIKKILIYLTTTRNIYKKLANGDELNNEEISLLKEIDHETYEKYINKTIKPEEWNLFKVKQLPIKILNNSLFGALGSGISFNWSDNVCAARITCTGRLHLRHAISWFKKYNCDPLLAVTDGINFSIPEKTNIKVNNNIEEIIQNEEISIDEAWQYKNKKGISALIEKYNEEIKIFNESLGKQNFISLDDDGRFISCLNLSRINYALLYEKKNKKTGLMEEKIKLTGNSIKSKTMPEYIEDFVDKGMKMILSGDGFGFVEYYYNYAEDIFYKRIPLKKIASKSKIKTTIKNYLNRGKDKNGRLKGKQAYMELLIEERNNIAKELFKENFDKIIEKNNIKDKTINDFTLDEIYSYVSDMMPLEPELDTMCYYINIGSKKSDGDSKLIEDKITGKKKYASKLISNKDIEENPNLTGEYNVVKYMDAFNKKVKIYLEGFDPEIRGQILVQIIRKKIKDTNGNKIEKMDFIRNYFTKDQLELKNFIHDDYDLSMKLEPKEVIFWNNYGFNPDKIWNGYSIYDDDKLYLEIYQHALDYINNLMKNSGKKEVKSVNDNIEKGDYILYKHKFKYSLGYNNGQFIEIIRENIDIPKSDIEIEFEKQSLLNEEKLKRAKMDESDELNDKEKNIDINELFEEFKKEFKIPAKFTIDDVNKIEKAKQAFEDFVNDSIDYDDEEDEIDEEEIYYDFA